MCRQLIGIAQCAPLDPAKCPLEFFCGRLHHFSVERNVCEDAQGGCVCFFGTCGRIDNVVGTQPVDLMAILKMRCLPCTTREEQVGERRRGRDFLATQLLTREPVSQAGMVAHAKMLKELWGGVTECPYHDDEDDSSQAVSINGGEVQKTGDGNVILDNNDNPAMEPDTREPPTSVKGEASNAIVDDEAIYPDTGISNTYIESPDECAKEHPPTQSIKQESTSSHGSGMKAQSVPIYDINAAGSTEGSEPSTEFKPLLGIQTSRWAPESTKCAEVPSDTEKPPQHARSTPNRSLFNAPVPEVGKTSVSSFAKDMRAFIGIK